MGAGSGRGLPRMNAGSTREGERSRGFARRLAGLLQQQRREQPRINADDADTARATTTATANEPRMNADDADNGNSNGVVNRGWMRNTRIDCDRGEARRTGAGNVGFGGRGRVARRVTRGSRRALAAPHLPAPAREAPPPQPPTPSGPGAGSPTPSRSDPRVSASIRGSIAVAVALVVSASSAFIRGSPAVAVAVIRAHPR